jgi:hypothetical protein
LVVNDHAYFFVNIVPTKHDLYPLLHCPEMLALLALVVQVSYTAPDFK